MAKKAKNGARAAAGEAKQPPARQTAPAGKLKSIMATYRKGKSDISEVSGELGTEIKTFTDKHHFSRRVLRILFALDRLPPEKLRWELEDLEHGLEASGLNQRAADAPAMEFGPGDGDEDDTIVKGKFPAPASVAAE